jgi:hypothetical protein
MATNIAFGNFNTSVIETNKNFQLTINITNATAVSFVSSNKTSAQAWVLSRIGTTDNWQLSGRSPLFNSTIKLALTASNATPANTIAVVKSITVATSAILTSRENMLYAIPSLKLWLETSDATTTTIEQNGTVSKIVDKANGFPFNLSSSESIFPDTSVFTARSIAFGNALINSGFHTSIAMDPIDCQDTMLGVSKSSQSVADENGYSTIFMLVSNTAVPVATPQAGLYALSSSDLNAADPSLFGAWGVKTSSIGADPLDVVFTEDETGKPVKPASLFKTQGQIPLGGRSIVCWRYGPSGLSVRVDGAATQCDYLTSNETITEPGVVSKAGFIPPKNISIIGSPQGYVPGVFGGLVAFSEYLSDAQVSSIENSYKQTHLNASPASATIATSSSLKQYANQNIELIFSVSNGTSHATRLNVTSTAGSNWVVINPNQSDPTIWKVTGKMPSTAQTFGLQLQSIIDGVATNKIFSLESISVTQAPTIGVLSNTKGTIKENDPNSLNPMVQFISTIRIDGLIETHFSVNLSSSDPRIFLDNVSDYGHGWSIRRDQTDLGLFHIEGNMPSTDADFTLTVFAENIDPLSRHFSSTKNILIDVIDLPIDATSSVTQYPLDLTGINPLNKIQNEPHHLTGLNGRGRQMLVLKSGPFFEDGLSLTVLDSSLMKVELVKHVDYEPVFQLEELSKIANNKNLFTAIAIINPALTGQILITYQTLGGEFVFDKDALSLKISDSLVNERKISWSNILNTTQFYPAGSHFHNVQTDLVGLSGLVAAIEQIEMNMRTLVNHSDVISLMAHLSVAGAAHGETKDQLGLGNVNNYAPATAAQAIDPTNSNTYLTPQTAYLSGKSNQALATTTQTGSSSLNLGNLPSDASNTTDALTAAGVSALMSGNNDFKTSFDNGYTLAFVQLYTGPGLTVSKFPIYWSGILCKDLDTFISAVRSKTGISNLIFDRINGNFLFPRGTTPPSMTIYTAAEVAAFPKTGRSVKDPVSWPLTYYSAP